MALTVNSNIPSLNAQRNLQKSTLALGKSLERLSSGLRINRAGDDAAGLAISESLRAQVRGLNVAVRNANDGISMVATAEGAIQEITNILQRMRELAVQAANDTNSPNNRASLNLEVTQLIEELTRISTTVQFNGRNLLDGTFQDMKLQTGSLANQTIDISISDLRATSLGAVAMRTSTAPTAALSNNDLLINAVNIGATSSDGISYLGGTYSAIAMANAINIMTGQTGVEATANATTVTGTSAITAVNVNGTTDQIWIDGVNIGPVNILGDDSDGALRKAINQITNQTGVAATVDTSGKLVLTAKDARNVTVKVVNAGAGTIGATNLGMASADGADWTSTGTYTLVSDESFSVTGNAPGKAGLTALTTAVDLSTAINTVSVTTHANATQALIRTDYALRQVNNIRADLGAITNRLEVTVANLTTISENLAASDSRIRDADFAYETAVLTKNQILQQAGVAILAQANMTPQAALQLLKG